MKLLKIEIEPPTPAQTILLSWKYLQMRGGIDLSRAPRFLVEADYDLQCDAYVWVVCMYEPESSLRLALVEKAWTVGCRVSVKHAETAVRTILGMPSSSVVPF